MYKRKEKSHNKTIQGKLLATSISIIAVSLLLVGSIAAFMNYISTISSLEQTMIEVVNLAADTVTREMEGYERLAVELSNNPILSSELSSKQEIVTECEKLAVRNGLISVGVGDLAGTDIASGASIVDREYYTAIKNGARSYISNPFVRKDTGEMNIFISAPILKNSRFSGIVYLAIDASVLCETVDGIQIGETGNASIINKSGDTIGYTDVQLVLDAYNTQDELKNDPQLEQLAAVERRLMAGETGFDTYEYGGVKKFTAFTPIDRTDGWGIYVAVMQEEFLRGTYFGIVIVIVLLVAAVLAGTLIMVASAKSIVKPITICIERIKLLSAGDIHADIPKITTGDETQILAESMGTLIENLKQVIGDIDYCLNEMSAGNFLIQSKAEESYIGDFSNILVFVNQLKDTLGKTMRQILESSEQVSLGANQMAQNATSLAEGATEQASAVEELTATINEVTAVAKKSAATAQDAYHSVMESVKKAESSNEEMKELSNAMERINDTSKDIKEIINAIEDIASQTNLLSLNASIEAARAGEAGRGFAIVADQIGKLAADSAQSAVATKQLIEKSMQEIATGNEITDKTVKSFNFVITEMNQFADIANTVSESSVSQSNTLQEVEQGIEQISNVVQSNSASAEESSATSEELSAQADTLNVLVSRFQC